jgi:hypothetical protein
MKHYHSIEFVNFFPLNLSDSKVVELSQEHHVSTDLASVCYVMAENIQDVKDIAERELQVLSEKTISAVKVVFW